MTKSYSKPMLVPKNKNRERETLFTYSITSNSRKKKEVDCETHLDQPKKYSAKNYTSLVTNKHQKRDIREEPSSSFISTGNKSTHFQHILDRFQNVNKKEGSERARSKSQHKLRDVQYEQRQRHKEKTYKVSRLDFNSGFSSPTFNQPSQYKAVRQTYSGLKENSERCLSPNPQVYEEFAQKHSARGRENKENCPEHLNPTVKESSAYFNSKFSSISSANGTLQRELEEIASKKDFRPPLKDISNTTSIAQYKSTAPSHPSTSKGKNPPPASFSSDQSSLQTISKISNPPEILRKMKWDKVRNILKFFGFFTTFSLPNWNRR